MASTNRFRRLAMAAAWLLLATLAGCESSAPPQSPPPTTIATQPAAEGIEAPPETPVETQPATIPVAATKRQVAGPALPGAAADEPKEGRLIEESGEAYSIQGTRVGYAHVTIHEVEEGGQKLLRTTSDLHMTLKRDGQTVKQQITLTSWDTPAGELVRFESSLTAGLGRILSQGRASAGTLAIDTITTGKTQSQTIPWPKEAGGLFATEQSLRRMPLKAGEKRKVVGLAPIFNVVGTTDLSASDYERATMPGRDKRLLKVESTVDAGGQKIESTLWLDEAGVIHKSEVPAIGQVALRTSKEDALQSIDGKELDLLVASVVKLKGELSNPLRTKRVVYRAKVKSGKIDGVFSECPSQSVKLLDERTAEITVHSVRPGDDAAKAFSKPTADDLAPNSLIQSDDPRIVQMAAAAAPKSNDPWEVATALEKYVARAVNKKNFSQAFATASEVAQTLEGDCTEHAVLLAALCRARKIPCRLAIGLVYYPPQEGFAYHMWNEAWINDRWIPLDGTLGQGGVAADRLKLADSNLSGATGLAAMLPVVKVFGRLELEVVSAQ
jgi:hypothetical protein